MRQEVQFGSRTIVYNLSFAKRKSLGIRVHPDEQVEVVAPLEAQADEIVKKLKAKAPWILKQLDYFSAFKPLTPERRFISGETHLYLGRQYRLKVIPSDTDGVKAYPGQLYVYTPSTAPADVQKQLDAWYRERANAIFQELAGEVVPRFKKYGIRKHRLLIQKMQKRWGSCTKDGAIRLNIELIKAPKSCIEYVLVHELCHLVHFNHTRAFFALLNHMMPGWEKRKEKLEYILA